MKNHETSENKAKFFTRGGQITFHNIRMFIQINKSVGHWCLWIAFIITAISTWVITPTQSLSASYYYFISKFLNAFHINHIFKMIWNEKLIFLTPQAILTENYFTEQVRIFYLDIKLGLFVGAIISTIFTMALMIWLTKRGKAQADTKFIRGAKLASSDEVAKLIKNRKKNSNIMISGVPMINRFEVQHTLIHGTVGAGKGQTFNQFLEQIKNRGDRAIVYDKGCVFTSIFYDKNKDKILNPFDIRCCNWDLWQEAQDAADFENIAESLIPMHGETDPFWVNAARTIFGSAAFTMQDDPGRSIDKLLKLILTAELDELASYLQGTEAATLVSDKIEKTAISIRSVITTYLKSLRFLRGLDKENKKPFSIREWIKNEDDNGWLFISSNAGQHAALRPLISMWLSMASISLLSLPENYHRRIWFICDELPTLHKLPQLPETIAEVRKFGGCFVLGMQSFAQLEKVYGASAAKEMFDLLNTRFFFRSPSEAMAKLVSLELGEQEIDQTRENYSYGANTIRDGISIGNQRVTQPIVTSSEIMCLEDLNVYLRLPSNVPVCRLKINFKESKKISDGFIKRDIQSDPFIEERISAVSGQANKGGVVTKKKLVSNKLSHVKKDENNMGYEEIEADEMEINDAVDSLSNHNDEKTNYHKEVILDL